MPGFMERRHKSLFTLVKIYEFCGWVMCITLVGLPVGIGMVMRAQAILVQVQNENNTRLALGLLERIATTSQGGQGGGGGSLALRQQVPTSGPAPQGSASKGVSPGSGPVACSNCGARLEGVKPGEFCDQCGTRV